MSAKNKRGLGRGIEALFEENKEKEVNINKKDNTFDHLPIELIKPNSLQPRKSFDMELLNELADSIRDKGVLQPIVVRESKGKNQSWQIIAGERRWRAAQIAGLHKIPVYIKNLKDDEVAIVALIENIQRENLSPIDEAKGYKRVMEKFSITQEELAKTMHRSRAYIANFTRLLSLPIEVQKLLENKKITIGQVRPIIGHKNCLKLAKIIISKSLNARQVEQLLKEEKKDKSNNKIEPDINILHLERELEASLGLQTKITDKNGKGKISFIYKNVEQLDELLKKIKL
ncbi:MAG: chromosome partitioning protein ParB [Pelagibacterales bacterium]|nr:chromosome partitioning protein ParB [Pelagibacterales bacterium]PPR16629.1 MAG: Chromosome-partitioning protein ParB [Alphaproteobacteria bacterium MarineAlpha9_Bin3]|tara:strand:+ start:39020 stop:39880 length:861 start_codon:yes stop_codon:yes gene_type:complete